MFAVMATYLCTGLHTHPKSTSVLLVCTCIRFRNVCTAGLPLHLRYSDNIIVHENHFIIPMQLNVASNTPPSQTHTRKRVNLQSWN